jgi:hypothetical protein
MNARQRVLAALGGRCAWCQSTTGPFEIDHIHGGGTQHRVQIRMPLERWLVRAYQRTGVWPVGYQVLCKACHDRKSGRRLTMPAKQGNTRQNLSLPEDLVGALKVAAMQRGEPLSTVVTAAIRAYLEGSASQTLLEDLQQRLTVQGQALAALEHAVKVLTLEVGEMRGMLTTQEKTREKVIEASNVLFDYVAARNGQTLPPGSRLKQFFTPRR